MAPFFDVVQLPQDHDGRHHNGGDARHGVGGGHRGEERARGRDIQGYQQDHIERVAAKDIAQGEIKGAQTHGRPGSHELRQRRTHGDQGRTNEGATQAA
jgi:hypothetical protein